MTAPDGGIRRLAGPALAAGVALAVCFLVADVTHPGGFFPKYLAAALSEEVLEARRLDYSPGYLAIVTVLAPLGPRGILAVQALLAAACAAAIAEAAGRMAGARWGLAAGLLAATYRPLAVHAGVHEPEVALAAVLALAVALGAASRTRSTPLPAAALAGLAGLAVGAASTLRPHWLALVPAWMAWTAWRQGPGRLRGAAAAAVLAGAAAVTLPLALLARAGGSAPMNPGPVLWEGNGPEATGLNRCAPLAVRALEAAHPESVDHGHVAYRAIAAAETGAPPAPATAARHWTALTRDAVRARPAEAAARLARKALWALAPHEAHDLRPAEELDRRTRRWLPWGFALLLVPLPVLLVARRDDVAAVAGPLAVAAVGLAVQVAFYASARQRLPMAVGLLVAAPVLARALAAGRTRTDARRGLVLALGLALALGVTLAGGRAASLNAASWSWAIGPEPGGGLARLARALEARDVAVEEAAVALREAAAGVDGGAPTVATDRAIERAALVLGEDATIDETFVAVPAYWRARSLLLRGERGRALEEARRAVAARPGALEAAALLRRLDSAACAAMAWPPPGHDAVSAALAARAAALADPAGDPRCGAAPEALAAFPELR